MAKNEYLVPLVIDGELHNWRVDAVSANKASEKAIKRARRKYPSAEIVREGQVQQVGTQEAFDVGSSLGQLRPMDWGHDAE